MDRLDIKRVQVLDALESLCDGRIQGELLVQQVMTTDVSCISPLTTVVELVRMFHAKEFRHLLVTDDEGRLLGVISDRDVLRCLGPGTVAAEALSKFAARDVMSHDVVTISSRAPITQAIDMMLDQGISCLPIVDGGRLVGILTNTDLHVVLQTLLQIVRLEGSSNSASLAAE